MTDKKRIGFIGVGLMGHGAAKNIVDAGYQLTVLAHNNRKPVEDLIGRGAREASDPAELARESDIVFICVSGSPQVEDVVFRPKGLLEGLREGTIVADCSTADPNSTEKVAAAIHGKGCRFVDTPLTRTPKEAEEGRLGLIYGGEVTVLEEIRPVLEAFCEVIIHAGPLGAAHKLKLVNNFIALGTGTLIAEGLCAAAKAGVDLKALVDVVSAGGANSVMFGRFADYILKDDDSGAQFALGNAEKDLRYYTNMTEMLPATSFIAEAIHQTLVMAKTLGYEQAYVPRIVDVLGKVNGVEVRTRK